MDLQQPSYNIWDMKYRLKDKDDECVDKEIEDTFDRVAESIAAVEKNDKLRKLWKAKFKTAMLNGALPAGRILSNAGAGEHKPSTSTINCTVSGIIEDSMEGIFSKLHDAALTLKAGCGIGYEFSTLRPSGAFVNGSGAKTSGPLSFMDIYDRMCATLMSAGGRRGAQMVTFDVSHPDIEDFIKAKREVGRLRQFNMSILITEDFIEAVKADKDWDLVWKNEVVKTVRAKELWDTIMKSTYDYAEPGFILIDKVNKMNNLWFCENIRATNPCWAGDTLVSTVGGPKRFDELAKEGKDVDVYCYDTKTNKTCVRTMRNPRKTASDADIITITVDDHLFSMTPNHQLYVKKDDTIEIVEAKDLKVGDELVGCVPDVKVAKIESGVNQDVYNGTVDDFHNYFVCGSRSCFLSKNCGEQPLPPNGSCLLGSINLTSFVKNEFTDEAEFDFETYEETIAVFTRMLDNVVEINGLPLKKQRDEIFSKRRHGMGFLGLGSTLTMLKIKYGSEDAIKFTNKISRLMAITGFRVGVELAKEKGEAPILTKQFTITKEMLKKNSNIKYDLGSKVSGRELLCESHYFDKWRSDIEGHNILEDIRKYGTRFTHHSSIAPTGTISLSLGNNASNGIEPSFSHYYLRNVLVEGKKTKDQVEVYSYEFLKWKEFNEAKGIEKTTDDLLKELPDYFSDTDNISPIQHIEIQAEAQKWIDSSISKTINVPTDFDFNEFKNIYFYAYQKGLKGCTTFRYNPEAFSGVLVKQSDLENTKYRFTLEDGSTIICKGTDTISYEGEQHAASNLYDSIREGTFGKY